MHETFIATSMPHGQRRFIPAHNPAMRWMRDGWEVLRYGVTNAGDVLAQLRQLPLADFSAITRDRPVLVLAPHPDDESLGCGGLIAESCKRGQDVAVVVLTDGSGSHPNSQRYPPPRLRALREQETRDAMAELGLAPEHVSFLGMRDTAAPRSGPAARACAARVAAIAKTMRAGTICTTWRHDPHGDHVAAAAIGRMAARQAGARLLSYPVWGWTLPRSQWLPRHAIEGFRLDITAHLAAKQRAIACHRSQVSGLIDDDPSGFQLLDDVLDKFAGSTETFLLDQAASEGGHR